MEEKTIDGKFTIIDEVCKCGHLKSQHDGISGHGTCDKKNFCSCDIYTWSGWVVR